MPCGEAVRPVRFSHVLPACDLAAGVVEGCYPRGAYCGRYLHPTLATSYCYNSALTKIHCVRLLPARHAGHNGCLQCLSHVQRTKPACPICRTEFSPSAPLAVNYELRDLCQLAAALTTVERDEGWQAVTAGARRGGGQVGGAASLCSRPRAGGPARARAGAAARMQPPACVRPCRSACGLRALGVAYPAPMHAQGGAGEEDGDEERSTVAQLVPSAPPLHVDLRSVLEGQADLMSLVGAGVGAWGPWARVWGPSPCAPVCSALCCVLRAVLCSCWSSVQQLGGLVVSLVPPACPWADVLMLGQLKCQVLKWQAIGASRCTSSAPTLHASPASPRPPAAGAAQMGARQLLARLLRLPPPLQLPDPLPPPLPRVRRALLRRMLLGWVWSCFFGVEGGEYVPLLLVLLSSCRVGGRRRGQAFSFFPRDPAPPPTCHPARPAPPRPLQSACCCRPSSCSRSRSAPAPPAPSSCARCSRCWRARWRRRCRRRCTTPPTGPSGARCSTARSGVWAAGPALSGWLCCWAGGGGGGRGHVPPMGREPLCE